mmetsp:Transcript_36797/g.115040  ORF Transcript_36797/g.115040 Transcript_36797/m.115040 type:complete len:172 (-) Transcript_36797:1225-1740(-)
MKSLESSSRSTLNGLAPEFTPTKKSCRSAPVTPCKNDANDACWEEACAAARWWAEKLRQQDQSSSNGFEHALRGLILSRCRGHWYPQDPLRGSGFRSIVNDVSTDPILLAAGEATRIRDIRSRLPQGVMWINPKTVKVKLEEDRWAETIFSCSAGSSHSSASASEAEDDDT